MGHRFTCRAALSVGLFLAAGQLAAAPLSWVEGPNLPVARDHAAAVINSDGTVVVTGGATSAYPLLSISLASTLSNASWGYSATSLDTTHVAPGAGIFSSEQILIFGGHEGDKVSLDLTGSFAPFSLDYYDLSRMTTPRSYHGYATDKNGNIYALGGLNDSGNVLASTERFANSTLVPPTSTWTTMAPMPDTVFGFPAVFDGNDSIYTFGGGTANTANSFSYNTYRYSVSTNSWTTMAPMPIATRESAAARGLNGKIYVMGGLGVNGAIANVQVYDTVTNSWTSDAPLPQPLYGAAAVIDGLQRLMIIGGMNSNNVPVATVWTSQRLSVADAAPVITSSPVTSGSVGTAYNYTVTATGSPPPAFTLTTAPSGMSIDSKSGAIAWTPAVGQDGAQSVAVKASNSVGNITQSYTINVAAIPPDITAPSVPTNLVANDVKGTSFRLDWTASTDNVGVTAYRVFLVTRCGFHSLYTCYTLQQTVAGNSAIISGLKVGTGYRYTVSAVDAAGNVSVVATSLYVTTLVAPTLSHGLICNSEKVTAIVNEALTVLCASPYTGYGVRMTGNPKPVLTMVSGPAGMVVNADATSMTGQVTWSPVVGVIGTYSATVRATNSEGTADFTFAYTIYPAGTDQIAPSYPGPITITNITRTSMTVNWTAATDNVGVTKYTAGAYSSCRRCITSNAVATTDGNGRSVTLTGLLPGRQFEVSVLASDAAGNNGPSGTLSGVFTLK